AHLGGQVAGHVVDVVRQVLPNTGDAGHLGLAAELTFRTDLARHPGDLPGEGVQLVDHGVDGVLEFEDFALDFDGDLLGQVAFLHGGGDLGDVAHLSRKVGGHQIDVVGKVLPDPGGPPDMGLPAQLPVGADFLDDTRDFEGEGAQLLNHRVDRSGRPQELALQGPAVQLEIHGLEEVAFGDRGNDPGNTGEILCVALVQLDDAVHLGGNAGHHARRGHRHPDREVALADLAQDRQDELGVGGRNPLGQPAPPLPRYGTRSLAELVPSLLTSLGLAGLANPLALEPAPRVCLLLVDGLGWELLEANRPAAPFLNAMAGEPLSAGFPATTAASLSSLATGLPPGEHGLVGYTMAPRGYDRAFNALSWSLYGLGPPGELLDGPAPETTQR